MSARDCPIAGCNVKVPRLALAFDQDVPDVADAGEICSSCAPEALAA